MFASVCKGQCRSDVLLTEMADFQQPPVPRDDSETIAYDYEPN